MKKITIFIDESGTLPDPKDPVIIVAAVGTSLVEKLRKILNNTKKTLKKGCRYSEIKFYNAGKRTKKKFLKELTRQEVSLFILIINKQKQKIADTPENFALLCWLILEDCRLFYGNKITKLVFDRHFHRLEDQLAFNQTLEKFLKQNLSILHVDSQLTTEVNTADMVAGSLLWKYTNKSDEFYQIIKNRIVSEKFINWKEAKAKFWQEKISLNRRMRPSKRDSYVKSNKKT
ncbi:MAG: DUF3800 domain-containing protein [Candidatus Shapirobacteria bacterium]